MTLAPRGNSHAQRGTALVDVPVAPGPEAVGPALEDAAPTEKTTRSERHGIADLGSVTALAARRRPGIRDSTCGSVDPGLIEADLVKKAGDDLPQRLAGDAPQQHHQGDD
jgi:hypothetical protein